MRWTISTAWIPTALLTLLIFSTPAVAAPETCPDGATPPCLACPSPSLPALPECTAPFVSTQSGEICGNRIRAGDNERRVDGYCGVRFATAERWQEPQSYVSRQTVRATRDGFSCPQALLWSPLAEQSHDCLMLDVFAPADRKGRPKPVMVYLYGGAFTFGGIGPSVQGHVLAAENDVLVVVPNYRIGAIGFLSGGLGRDRVPSNLGIQDQLAALRWVKQNIRRFGGDPNNVTLFGTSAGAASVGVHLVSPESQDLFDSAIMMSNPIGLPLKTAGDAAFTRQTFDVATGCNGAPGGSLACLKKLPIWEPDCSKSPPAPLPSTQETCEARGDDCKCCTLENGACVSPNSILAKQGATLVSIGGKVEAGLASFLTFAPEIDRKLIPMQPVDVQTRKAVMAGNNADEAVMFMPLDDFIFIEPVYGILLDALFGPVIAGEALQRQRYKPLSKPLDFNRRQFWHVMDDYLFACPVRQVLRNARRPHRTFGYVFTHEPSFPVWDGILQTFPLGTDSCVPGTGQVCHAVDIPFEFGLPYEFVQLGNGVYPRHEFTDPEKGLSRRIREYFTAFARWQRPGSAGPLSVAWPPFSAADPGLRQVLDAHVMGFTDDGERNCDLWDEFGYDDRNLVANFWKTVVCISEYPDVLFDPTKAATECGQL